MPMQQKRRGAKLLGQTRQDSLNWCHLADVIQTSAIKYSDDYVLKDLVETFELSGDLLNV
jgi:hypothetical protein